MLTGIQIKNFKTIQDSGLIELKPLTLFFGPNNAGKSSILQNLLLTKQTLSRNDEVARLITNGNYVQLGSFPEFIRNHNIKSNYSLSFRVDLPVKHERVVMHEKFSATVDFAFGKRSKRITVKNFILEKVEGPLLLALTFNQDGKLIHYKSDIVPIDDATKKYLKRHLVFSNFLPSLDFSILINDNVPNKALLKPVLRRLREIKKILRTTFYHFHYIGPLRRKTERMYIVSGEFPTEVGFSGERTFETVYMDKRIAASKRKNLLGKVSKWAEEFGFFTGLELKTHSASPYFSVIAKDSQTGVAVNLADVGFGISQVLPAIVQGYLAAPGSLLLMEQPEIHLHPRIQASLADVFIDVISNNRLKLLIETHSEHILLRIRRRIVEGLLNPDDIAIYFVEHASPESAGAAIKRIRITNDGQLFNWPENFFASDVEDAYKIVEGISKNREQKNANNG